jgi:steroid delta-isomerase-like uncharacterized protein
MTEQTPFEAHLAVVRKALDAISRGDFPSLASTVTPDFVRTDLGEAFVLEGSGADPLVQFIATVRAAMPDFAMEVVDGFGNDERAAVQIRLTGTHLGEFRGTPPTGRRIEFNGISLYRFRDGLICENHQLLDVARMMRELTAGASTSQAAVGAA